MIDVFLEAGDVVHDECFFSWVDDVDAVAEGDESGASECK